MVEGVIQDFVSYLNLQKRFSPLTAKSYQHDLNEFFNFISDGKKDELKLSEISYQSVRAFIAEQVDKGIAASSVNRKLSSLKSFFK